MAGDGPWGCEAMYWAVEDCSCGIISLSTIKQILFCGFSMKKRQNVVDIFYFHQNQMTPNGHRFRAPQQIRGSREGKGKRMNGGGFVVPIGKRISSLRLGRTVGEETVNAVGARPVGGKATCCRLLPVCFGLVLGLQFVRGS